ncbi:MAG: MinD/ParA family protein [Pseudomonadota bacterium]
MSQIISIHSFRGGTGKSNTTANLAAQFALTGKRVGIVDTDIQSPGIHVLFGLDGSAIEKSLNGFLSGQLPIEEAAHDVTGTLPSPVSGTIYLIPSSANASEIVSILREGYDVATLTEGYKKLVSALNLDVLLIDTHPGLNEETLFSIAISHGLVIVMRPDQQDYEGTGVTVEVARSLDIPSLALVVNKTPASFDVADVRARVEGAYDVDTVTVLPHSDEMMALASGGIFSMVYPDHPLTALYAELRATLSA